MIVTVTLNPAIDKTAHIKTLCPRELNRLGMVEQDIGGKGINVSRAIAALGGSTVACGFVAGQTGRTIEELLTAQNIRCNFVHIAGETRTNLKIVEEGGWLTELNEAGPPLCSSDLEKLEQQLLEYAGPDTLFVIAGSVPAGVPEDYYGQLIRKIHQKGGKVFLDADGPLFAHALPEKPDIIKPNGFELTQYFGLEEQPTSEELLALAQRLCQEGIPLVCVSLGSDGAAFAWDNQVWQAPALKVPVCSTVGAGDAMVAAIAWGLDQHRPIPECLKMGIACSAGAVTTPGTNPPSGELVRQLASEVSLSPATVETVLL